MLKNTTIALTLAWSAAAFAQPMAILNVTVIDTEKGVATPGRVVLMEGEKITAVADAASVRLDGSIAKIDGTGLFAYPGLIDSHVHYVDAGTYGPLFIAHGVTAVRDMGGPTGATIALRDRLNSGKELGPRMKATGAIVDGKPPVWPFSEACDTPEEGRAAVRKLKEAGVDYIKVYSRLKPEVYRAILDEAKAVGLKAVGHVPQSVTIPDAVVAGQYTNEHMMRSTSRGHCRRIIRSRRGEAGASLRRSAIG
jgi:imidazolonepropionase-like amidohydrolase